MNTETAPETFEPLVKEPSGSSTWVGVAVVLGFVAGAAALYMLQGDDDTPVKVIDKKHMKYSRPEIAETGPYPAVDIDKKDHHFGSMEFGETGEHSYIVTNKGESNLVLKQGPKSCACTRYDIEKKNLAPGESTKILVEWKPKEAEPIFRQVMNLYTNDPKAKVIPLVVTGTVAALIKIVPGDDWDLGNMEAGEPASIDGVVVTALLEDFELEDITPSHPELTVKTVRAQKDDIKTLRANDGIEMHVTLGTKIPAGPFRGTIKFKVKNHPERDYTINVKAHRDGSIQFVGTSNIFWNKRRQLVDLGQFSASDGKTGKMLLYVSGDEEMVASDIKTSPNFLKCALEKDPTFTATKKTRYILTFKVPPGSPAGGYAGPNRGRVRMKTNHAEYPEIKLGVDFVTMKDID